MFSRLAVLLFLALSTRAVAEERPRVAVHPLIGEATAAAKNAFLVEAARQPIAMVSGFEVSDALAARPGGGCAMEEACLVALAEQTHAGWAVGMSARFAGEGDGWLVTARVVAHDGTIARRLDDYRVAGLSTELDRAFRAAFSTLELGRLGQEPVVAATPPELVVASAPFDKPSDKPVVEPAAPKPVVLEAPALAVRPAKRWQSTAALGAGAVALLAAGAGASLTAVNLGEAARLRSALRGGLVPVDQVNSAAAIDERTVAATALFAGAGVAAAASVVLALTGQGDEPAVAAAPLSGGALVTFSGRWP